MGLNAPVSCMSFFNVIPHFKQVYDATNENQGDWKATYNCRDIPDPFPWGTVAGVVIGILVIAVAILGFKLYQKKNVKGENTGGADTPLVNNA